MMITLRMLYIHYLSLSFVVFGDPFQQGFFNVLPSSFYIPRVSSNFLMNVTSNTLSNRIRCAQQCLKYFLCQTATYYEKTRTCSLFSEKFTVGQIWNEISQSSSLLTMVQREPALVIPSAQFNWSSSGVTVAGSPSGNSGSDLSHLNSPIEVYYDQTNNLIIVSDNQNNRVMQFTLLNLQSNGTVRAGGNGVGCNCNQFTSVVGVALDSSRQLYVSDSACYRILKFSASSNSSTCGTNISSGYMGEGIFIDPFTDELYVASYDNNAVFKFAKNSTNYVVVAGGNGAGSALNQLSQPNSAYFDYQYTQSVYVADNGNNRVLRFPSNSTSTTYGVVVAGGNGGGSNSNQLNNPRFVLIDENGIVYVSDGGNNRIQCWLPNATNGSTVFGDTAGSAANQLNSPEAILFDKNHNFIIVDRGNNRVQLLNITSL